MTPLSYDQILITLPGKLLDSLPGGYLHIVATWLLPVLNYHQPYS